MAQTSLQVPGLAVAASPPAVELRGATKVYASEPAVAAVDLSVQPGEFFSILGPSGCGKTTLLRAIAGFETLTAGEIRIGGQVANDLPAYRRPVNTVFQSYALFNHLTVAENIAFGLRIARRPKVEVSERVQAALASVRLDSFATRYPNQLSGGQRQRVALARALINRPTVLLLDEPLGALDLKLRKEMQVELSRLHQELGLTFIMVTHDQEEALSLSERIAVLRAGRIEQIGTPSEIYERPQTAFVADFIGDTNLFVGEIETQDDSTLVVRTAAGLPVRARGVLSGVTGAIVSIRPEKIALSFVSPPPADNCFAGHLRHAMYLGTHVQAVV
ncbi:MAG: ABC transporter ATP-binding protein, partial [Spirulinaceae cyanobacterium RM2_2_10]|nr:ABC transporter ATP-binding protein [Spirulinaceae cyanobacterium RM2_2_10]